MHFWQVAFIVILVCGYRQTSGQSVLVTAPSSSQSASSAAASKVCGGADTRLTLCFPGTPDEATCVYHVISNYSSKALPTSTQLRNCPQKPLFGGPCQSLPGTLYIAYGPCNSDDTVLPANATDSLAVSDWLDVLGINSIQALGGLFVRGYAFQPQYDVLNVTFLPDLENFIPPSLVEIDNVDYFQVTISGLRMPPMPKVQRIPAGLSILNSPDEDFTNPPRFSELSEISVGLSIAGCTRLKTLNGLENLLGGSSLTNIEVIANLILWDISALSDFFRCQANGSTLLTPDLLVGTIGMHPIPLQPDNKGCTLNTPRQICEYIATSDRCPSSTEYIRYPDGTITRIPSEIPTAPGLPPQFAPTIAPRSTVSVPALAPNLPLALNLSLIG